MEITASVSELSSQDIPLYVGMIKYWFPHTSHSQTTVNSLDRNGTMFPAPLPHEYFDDR